MKLTFSHRYIFISSALHKFVVEQQLEISKVVKRDGRIVDFDIKKITEAIFSAAESVGGKDRVLARALADAVLEELAKQYKNKVPTVENIQDVVEKVLIEHGHARTAKAYILYRHKKEEERQRRAFILGKQQEDGTLHFSNEALKILHNLYLLKDEEGNVIETPQEMLLRVAKYVASADKHYGASVNEIRETEKNFYSILANLTFLPNSPTLSNAGTKNSQLSACFVLPIEDTMESIFGTLRDAAVIHQRGGGTGFSFSRLRPKNDRVKRHLGVASGPVSFMKVFDAALDIIKQGGIRPGANMAVLRVDHPDILRFIEVKRDKSSLKNFNISVAVTDRFMKAVEEDREYFIKNPRTEKFMGKLRARDVFAVITQNAWKTGDPGLIFLDEINRKNPAKHLGEIETTNQCGEAPLLPYESCALGSIDVAKFVNQQERDLRWEELRRAVHAAVHFLDNVIDVNAYPTKESEETTKKTRRFGLGIMGLAYLFFKLGIKYDSEEGLQIADKLMSFIKDAAYEKSEQLASQRGVCPAWEDSDHQKVGRKMRNISCLSISQTGTRSIIAGTSPGCEPIFAISYQRSMLSSSQFMYINPLFEKEAKERGFYTPELIRKISLTGSIQSIKEIPKEVRDLFVTAQDITPEWHIRMQATLQKYVDNAISKTINLPRTAAIKDVEEAYLLAWKLKCKGLTVYRDGSYEDQVITIGE